MTIEKDRTIAIVELTDAEILAIWESLTGDKTLIDFARACIAASFKQ